MYVCMYVYMYVCINMYVSIYKRNKHNVFMLIEYVRILTE